MLLLAARVSQHLKKRERETRHGTIDLCDPPPKRIIFMKARGVIRTSHWPLAGTPPDDGRRDDGAHR